MSDNMSELASAYITLIPKMPGAKAQIEKQLGKEKVSETAVTEGKKWGDNFSKNLTKGLTGAEAKLASLGSGFSKAGSSFSKIGSSLTRSITMPAIAAGTALAGLVAFKGFTRLRDIDTAKAKLGALGHSADDVKAIMKDASSSVLGTSYALNEAATTAAGAVAAGIKPGQQLTSYLTNVADAAAIANVPMEEMGSIFNRTQTAGRAYMMELTMLSDRGIPIYQWIAKEAGITADKVREMAAAGKIDSKLYFDAIKKNIGGAAKEMGETSFVGISKNISASIARIGENFLDAGGEGGGFFSQIKPLLVDFKGWLGGIELKAKNFGIVFGVAFKAAIPKVRELIAVFSPLGSQTMTMAQQMDLWKTRVTAAFDWVISKAQALKSWYDGLSDSSKKFVQMAPLMALAAGPVMKVIGPVLTLTGGILNATSAMAGFAKTLMVAKAASVAAGAATAGAGASTGMLAGAMGLLGSPVGVAAASLFAVVSAGYLLEGVMSRNVYLTSESTRVTNQLSSASSALAANKRAVAQAIDLVTFAQEAENGAILNLEGANLRAERATKFKAEAKKQYGKKSLEYREALHNEKQALADVTKAEKAKADASASLTKEKDHLHNHSKRTAALLKAEKDAADASKKIAEERANASLHGAKQQEAAAAKGAKGVASAAERGLKTHNVADLGGNMAARFAAAISGGAPEATAAGASVGVAARTGASGFSLHDVGVDLGAGLARGLSSQQPSVAETTRELIVAGVRGTAVKYGQIKSPSRMMARIGKFLGQGLTAGLKASGKSVQKAALALMAKVTNAFAISAPLTFAESYVEAVNKAKEQQDKLADLNKSMPKKPTGKVSAKDKKAYNKELKTWQKQVGAAAKAMTSAYTKAGTNLAQAFAFGINEGIKSAKDGDASSMISALDGIIDFTTGSLRSQLQGYRNSLESIATTISGLNDKLTEQKDAMKSYADSITESFSGYSKSAFEDQGVDAQDYIASLKERLEASEEFAARMRQLEGLGLNQAAIDAIAGQGIEQGGSIASALLNGADKAAIEEMNSLYFKTEAIGKNLGTTLADSFYRPGIDALTGQIDNAKAAADKIGASIALAIKPQLDAAGGWGKLMIDNLAAGIKSQSSVAVAAASDLADKIKQAALVDLPVFGYNVGSVPAAGTTLAAGGNTTTNTTTNTINVTISANDTKEISTIDEFLARLKRAEGVYA